MAGLRDTQGTSLFLLFNTTVHACLFVGGLHILCIYVCVCMHVFAVVTGCVSIFLSMCCVKVHPCLKLSGLQVFVSLTTVLLFLSPHDDVVNFYFNYVLKYF